LALPSTKLMCKERVCWMITYLSVWGALGSLPKTR
jgi:hypothetical protein